MSFRDESRKRCPPWLQEGRNERLMYVIFLGIDFLAEKALQAVEMFAPTTCDASALPVIGADGLIARGATELESRYRQRLQKRIETWQHAGTPWRVLQQMLHILLELRPAAKHIAVRYDAGSFPFSIVDTKWNTYAAGDDADATQPTRTLVEPGNWDWDSSNRCPSSWTWSRKWIVLESVGPNAWCEQSTATWDEPGHTWDGDGRCWDLTCSPDVTASIWNELVLWGSAHAPVVALIISFDATHFDPAQPSGGGINPDGGFGRWSKMSGNVQVAARTSISGAVYGHRVQDNAF